jgi:hypothetical protein
VRRKQAGQCSFLIIYSLFIFDSFNQLSIFESLPASTHGPLGAIVKDETTDNKQTVKQWTKCQPFAKLKELQADTQSQR